MIRIALFTFIFMLPGFTVSAQDLSIEPPAAAAEANIADFTSQVLNLNKIDPYQNPQYTLGSRALSYRLLDQNRRGLGKVNDITIGKNGALESIQAEVIATGFNEVLDFDVTAYNVMPESDAYTVTLTRNQLEKNLSQFLAETKTAAGGEGGQPITVQSLIGARVQTDKRTQVGLVDDVLIQDQQKVAVALLLTLMGRTGKTTVAIPYKDAKIDREGQKATVELSEEEAKIVNNFAKTR
jgi:hypothetical protein